MDLSNLIKYLEDKGFQDPKTGNLFFPAYMYLYEPEQEYQLREQIKILTARLQRPNHFLECLVLNIYDEFIDYLKSQTFAGETVFDQIMELEEDDVEDADDWIRDEINKEAFYDFIETKVKNYFKDSSAKRVYLLVHGFGSIFPYLRSSTFLKRTEKLVKDFKMILFFPGKYDKQHYSLFNVLSDENMYRVNLLNNMIDL